MREGGLVCIDRKDRKSIVGDERLGTHEKGRDTPQDTPGPMPTRPSTFGLVLLGLVVGKNIRQARPLFCG